VNEQNKVEPLNLLAKEHGYLLSMLEQLIARALNNVSSWKEVIIFCENYIENNHHQKEEEFIFNAIKNIPQLKGGGPQCTYYFGFQMSNPSIKQAITLVQKTTHQITEPQWTEKMLEFRKSNLPLVIPCEDHEAGRMLLRAAQNLEPNQSSYNDSIKLLISTYLEIQKIHFEKEERCLFKLCSSLLTQSQWNEIIKEMRIRFPDIGPTS
jgi:hemerythrin-like domain-containing protein